MKPQAVLLVFLLLPVSGCFDDGEDQRPPQTETASSTGTSTATATSTRPPIQTNDTIPVPRSLVLNNCTGWDIFQNRAAGTTGGSRPEGWEAEAPENFAALGTTAYLCKRISLGHFERPIHMLIDGHSDATFPESCIEDMQGLTHFVLVSMVYIDDPEIADYFTTNYGLAVTLLQGLAETNEALPDGSSLRTWSWTVNGATSTVTIPDTQARPDNEDYDRYFWQRGVGLVELEIAPRKVAPPGQLVAEGMLASNHPLSQPTQGMFVGQGEYYPSLQASGDFTFYSDLLCEKPIP